MVQQMVQLPRNITNPFAIILSFLMRQKSHIPNPNAPQTIPRINSAKAASKKYIIGILFWFGHHTTYFLQVFNNLISQRLLIKR